MMKFNRSNYHELWPSNEHISELKGRAHKLSSYIPIEPELSRENLIGVVLLAPDNNSNVVI